MLNCCLRMQSLISTMLPWQAQLNLFLCFDFVLVCYFFNILSCGTPVTKLCFSGVLLKKKKFKNSLFLSFGQLSEGLLLPGAEHLWRHELRERISTHSANHRIRQPGVKMIFELESHNWKMNIIIHTLLFYIKHSLH